MHPARARLAFDELLASQLAIALVRHHNRTLAGRATKGDGALQQARAGGPALPATPSQHVRRGAEIAADMAKPERMVRLLQGDVGSGKTLVAFLAMLTAVEAGAQAALMAPTEILARQHYATIAPLAEAAGVRLALLTGRDGQRQKKETLQGLADGTIQLVVGTHALVQEDVEFADLALAVVDEQHRFGVHQRMALSSKGQAVDLLVMTATPIPRTLMLAAYGDLDVSKLTEKPAGRQPIDTRTLPLERIGEVVDAVGRMIGTGASGLLGLPADRGIRGRRPRQRRGAPSPAERALPRQGRAGARPAEGRRARGDHGGVRRRASCRSWWRRR